MLFFLEKVDDGKLLKEYAIVYKGKIVAQGNRYDKAYQKSLMELQRTSYSVEKVGEYLESKYNFAVLLKNENFLNTYTIVLQEKYHLLKQFINLEEEAVIRFYTTSAYDDLNKFLRGLSDIKIQIK